jgi:hypothetical protein
VRRWILVLVVLAEIGSPASVAAVELSQTCVNPDVPFAVRFPAGWWVHPADSEREISQCEYFGPIPFTLTENADGGLAGGTVVMHVADACVGYFRDVVSRQEITIAGRPTTRIELAASEGDPTPGPAAALLYWIHVRGQECESADTRYIVASTGSTDPEAYAENAAVLDAMMETFGLSTIPDGAMPAEADTGPVRWLGIVLLSAAVALGAWRFGPARVRRSRAASRRAGAGRPG